MGNGFNTSNAIKPTSSTDLIIQNECKAQLTSNSFSKNINITLMRAQFTAELLDWFTFSDVYSIKW